jgi:hypothetical protein
VTGKSWYTPIYTRQDLADLVAQHDREHPDHDDDCSCRNGLIAMLRTYFAPVRPFTNAIPAPNVPPDEPPTNNDNRARKPWLNRRPDETKEQYDFRISRSCYNCGTFIVDGEALNRHEDECSAQGRRAKATNDDA